MIDIVKSENERLKEQLAALRQTIIQAEPMVMFDGRFEDMMTAPINIIDVAEQMIRTIPQMRHQKQEPIMVD